MRPSLPTGLLSVPSAAVSRTSQAIASRIGNTIVVEPIGRSLAPNPTILGTTRMSRRMTTGISLPATASSRFSGASAFISRPSSFLTWRSTQPLMDWLATRSNSSTSAVERRRTTPGTVCSASSPSLGLASHSALPLSNFLYSTRSYTDFGEGNAGGGTRQVTKFADQAPARPSENHMRSLESGIKRDIFVILALLICVGGVLGAVELRRAFLAYRPGGLGDDSDSSDYETVDNIAWYSRVRRLIQKKLATRTKQVAVTTAKDLIALVGQDDQVREKIAEQLRGLIHENAQTLRDALQSEILRNPAFEDAAATWASEMAIKTCEDPAVIAAMGKLIKDSTELPGTQSAIHSALTGVVESPEMTACAVEFLSKTVQDPRLVQHLAEASRDALENMALDPAVHTTLSNTLWSVVVRAVMPKWFGSAQLTAAPAVTAVTTKTASAALTVPIAILDSAQDNAKSTTLSSAETSKQSAAIDTTKVAGGGGFRRLKLTRNKQTITPSASVAI